MSELQRRIELTQKQINQFKKAREILTHSAVSKQIDQMDPRIRRALIDSYDSQVEDLETQLLSLRSSAD